MRNIYNLDHILKNHKLWLETRSEKEPKGVRADLMYTDLSHEDLRHEDLRYALLNGADLSWADLRGADLSVANLRGANLRGADLRNSNLSNANLENANLREAGLMHADLTGANLSGIDLRDADLRGAKNVPYIPYACPDTGSFIGYKRAGRYIVQLEIPSDAKRCSATSRKCRCDKAKVLSITEANGSPADTSSVPSNYDSSFVYTVGKMVAVADFDPDRWNECSTGIHFFINRQEAVYY